MARSTAHAGSWRTCDDRQRPRIHRRDAGWLLPRVRNARWQGTVESEVADERTRHAADLHLKERSADGGDRGWRSRLSAIEDRHEARGVRVASGGRQAVTTLCRSAEHILLL